MSTLSHNPAPIAVFAFNRLGLLQQTLSALTRCKEFSASAVHVFSDGARDNREGESGTVERLRYWLRHWAADHGATVHEAATNRGLRTSIVSGTSALLEQDYRVIVIEDDILVSPHFLTFMNEALDAYRERTDIVQVSGYFVPHNRRLPKIGLLRSPATRGWATWRRAWQHYRDDAAALLREVRSADTNSFNYQGSYAYLDELGRNADGTLDTWAVRWYASVFLRGGLTIYPARSLTRNLGFGEDGTNCGPGTMAPVYSRQRIDSKPVNADWNKVGAVETPSFAAALEEFYRWQQDKWTRPTWRERVKARLNKVLVSIDRE